MDLLDAVSFARVKEHVGCHVEVEGHAGGDQSRSDRGVGAQRRLNRGNLRVGEIRVLLLVLSPRRPTRSQEPIGHQRLRLGEGDNARHEVAESFGDAPGVIEDVRDHPGQQPGFLA